MLLNLTGNYTEYLLRTTSFTVKNVLNIFEVLNGSFLQDQIERQSKKSTNCLVKNIMWLCRKSHTEFLPTPGTQLHPIKDVVMVL